MTSPLKCALITPASRMVSLLLHDVMVFKESSKPLDMTHVIIDATSSKVVAQDTTLKTTAFVFLLGEQ